MGSSHQTFPLLYGKISTLKRLSVYIMFVHFLKNTKLTDFFKNFCFWRLLCECGGFLKSSAAWKCDFIPKKHLKLKQNVGF